MHSRCGMSNSEVARQASTSIFGASSRPQLRLSLRSKASKGSWWVVFGFRAYPQSLLSFAIWKNTWSDRFLMRPVPTSKLTPFERRP
jgi:hypothetical protein